MRSKKRSSRQSGDRSNFHSFDDGIDPRRYFHSPGGRKPDRKALQLCTQAREALNTALAGECGDPVLQDLFVAAVSPASGSNRLLVTIEVSSAETGPRFEQARAQAALRLERARGLLRSAVAAAICRRRTPDLEFQVIPASKLEDEGVDA